jgi:hypothetical protein
MFCETRQAEETLLKGKMSTRKNNEIDVVVLCPTTYSSPVDAILSDSEHIYQTIDEVKCREKNVKKALNYHRRSIHIMQPALKFASLESSITSNSSSHSSTSSISSTSNSSKSEFLIEKWSISILRKPEKDMCSIDIVAKRFTKMPVTSQYLSSFFLTILPKNKCKTAIRPVETQKGYFFKTFFRTYF